jgi:hypothetical protein
MPTLLPFKRIFEPYNPYRMKTRFTLLFIMAALSIKAQPIYTWALNGVQSGDNCTVIDVAFDQEQNTYALFKFSTPVQFGGQTLSIVGGGDLGVVKYSLTGQVQWVLSAGSPGEDFPRSLAVAANGMVYVTGSLTGNADFGGNQALVPLPLSGQEALFTAAINPGGTWQWVTVQEGTAVAFGSGVAADASGNAVVVGAFSNGDLILDNQTFLQGGDRKPILVKYNASGVQLFARAGETEFGGEFTDVLCSPDDKIIACGHFGTFDVEQVVLNFGGVEIINQGDAEISLTTSNAFIAAFDNNGTCLWGNSAGSLLYETFARSIARDAQGNIYVSGMYQEELNIGSTSVSSEGEEGDMDTYLLSASPDGNWRWVTSLGTAEEALVPSLVFGSTDGNIYLSGELPAEGYVLADSLLLPEQDKPHFLCRVNPLDGTYLWTMAHPEITAAAANTGSDFFTGGRFIEMLQLGTITLTTTGPDADAYVCRHGYTEISIGSEEPTATEAIRLYPNPGNGSLRFSKLPETAALLSVCDLQGREIASLGLNANGTAIWNAALAANGMYLIQLRDRNNQIIQTLPYVLQR